MAQDRARTDRGATQVNDVFDHFRRREVGGQIAEMIWSERNRFSGRAPERERACKRLLQFAAQINPALARYAV